MIRKRRLIMAVASAALLVRIGAAQDAQSMPPVRLRISIENLVRYDNDTPDWTKFGTYANKATSLPVPGPTFGSGTGVADVVAVNGQPVKGLLMARAMIAHMKVNPTPGQGIADITGENFVEWEAVILKADGTIVGSLSVLGLVGSSAIIGGTGAFLGARGQTAPFSANDVNTGDRRTSVIEDPSNRRSLGGGKETLQLLVIPMSRPQIVATANGPAVVHANDFTLVTAAKPAKAGEILTLFATGLGPTTPGVDPDQPFTADPLQVVNSPVDVTINGAVTEVLYAGGYPGTTDTYQVNFRLPSVVAPGMARLQITAAWIPGKEANIAVQ
jgi:hypothetical protein